MNSNHNGNEFYQNKLDKIHYEIDKIEAQIKISTLQQEMNALHYCLLYHDIMKAMRKIKRQESRNRFFRGIRKWEQK